MSESSSLTAEEALKQLREMFPGVEWITCRTTARDYGDRQSIGRFSEIDIDGMTFRTDTLGAAMAQVRAWKESQSKEQ